MIITQSLYLIIEAVINQETNTRERPRREQDD